MTNLWKKEPKNNWLCDLDKHRSPIIKEFDHPWPGPWYSDDGEDGVLNYLFEYINDEYKFAVDIGSAHGYGGSQVRYLVDKYDWGSTEMDGRSWNPMHPRVKDEWITLDNVCDLLNKYKTPKEFDLLSLDIDSMDYYILEKILIGGYRPNVAIIEFNPIFNYNESYVRIYDKDYTKDSTSNYGVSLKGLELLLSRADYTLIHTFDGMEDRKTNNALFIHNKFINKDTKVIPIEKLHPEGWIERWKDNNSKYGGTLEKIKSCLITNTFNKLEE